MRELTETTAKDAAIMKTFATITLILLPMSVVSVGITLPTRYLSLPTNAL